MAYKVFKEIIPLLEKKKVCSELITIPINSDYSVFNKLLILLGPMPKDRQKIDPDKAIVYTSDNFKDSKLTVKHTTLNITDFLVLSYLNELIKKNNSRVISTSLYDIASHIFSTVGGDKYKIIRESLDALKSSIMMMEWDDINYSKNNRKEQHGIAFSFVSEMYFNNMESNSGKIAIWMSDNYSSVVLQDKKRLMIFNRKKVASIKSHEGRQILLFLSCLPARINKIHIDKIKKAIKSDKELRRFKELIIRITPKINDSLKADIKIDADNYLIINREKGLDDNYKIVK